MIVRVEGGNRHSHTDTISGIIFQPDTYQNWEVREGKAFIIMSKLAIL